MSDDFTRRVTESFLNLSRIFNEIGEVNPYYSVLSDPKYMTQNLTAENLSAFYASGQESVGSLFDTVAKYGIKMGTGEALDFGCGVGRVTIPLARRFGSVTGCDISESNLAVASKESEKQGLTNIHFEKNEFNLVHQLGARRYDLIYSILVLQHMIPPLMKLYISQFMQLLKPGGIAYFQLPTKGETYHFDQKSLDESIDSDIVQIHALASQDVFAMINAGSCHVLDMIELDCVGPGWQSYVFLVTKP